MYISFGTGNSGNDGDKLLDCSVQLKVLSIMPITRERQSDHSGWEVRGRSDARSGERPDTRVWDFY